MPPRPKKPKKTLQQPQSVDDFQEAAEAEEQTGGKWRAGDKAKSSRAFARAIDIYNKGLARHPRNFDLAYNKARLELEVSQQPGLVQHLPGPFLDQALASHRYALGLNQENPDILFNTAQILTTIAEHAAEDADPQEFDSFVPAGLLREALELLNACFARQELLLDEQARAWAEVQSEDPGQESSTVSAPSGGSSEPSSEDGQFATVESATTPRDLYDTALASLAALTQLFAVVDPASIDSTHALGETLATAKLPAIIETLPESERPAARQEVANQNVAFRLAFADAQFTAGTIDARTYADRLSLLATIESLDDVESHCTAAEALLQFLSSIFSSLPPGAVLQGPDLPLVQSATARASAHYTHALSLLDPARPPTPALSLSIRAPDPAHLHQLAALLEALGDLAMLDARTNPAAHPARHALAQEYYARAAAACAGAHGADTCARSRGAEVRRHVARLAGVAGRADEAREAWALLRTGFADAPGLPRRVARQMVDEGLLGEWWGAVEAELRYEVRET